MKNIIAFLLFHIVFFLVPAKQTFGQTKEQDSLRSLIVNQFKFDIKEFPDSVALYTYSIQISVEKTNEGVIVKDIYIDEQAGISHLVSYEFLRDINFSVFLGSVRQATIVIPFVIFVYNGSRVSSPQGLLIDSWTRQMHDLFRTRSIVPGQPTIYLKPYSLWADKAIYD